MTANARFGLVRFGDDGAPDGAFGKLRWTHSSGDVAFDGQVSAFRAQAGGQLLLAGWVAPPDRSGAQLDFALLRLVAAPER